MYRVQNFRFRSTHIIEEAADVLEEVIILHEGKILVEADTQAFVDSAVHVPMDSRRGTYRVCVPLLPTMMQKTAPMHRK